MMIASKRFARKYTKYLLWCYDLYALPDWMIIAYKDILKQYTNYYRDREVIIEAITII